MEREKRLNNLPERIKLRDICEIQGGYAFRSIDFKSRGIPLIRISNINNYEVRIDENTVFLDEAYLQNYPEFLVKKGDILIALSGATTGKYGRYVENEPALLNQRIGRLRNFDLTRVNPVFLFFWLGTLEKEIFSKAYGAAQPNISPSKIASFSIKLPSLETQAKIVSVLEKAEQLGEWRKQSDKLTQEYLYSVFVKMFGNRGPNHVIGDIADFISSGSTPLGGQATYLDEGIVFIRSQNVHMNELKLNDVSHISEDVHRKMRRTWVKNGDVLLNITGASLGRVAVYDGESYKANVNQHVCIIRVNRERALPSYISYFLSMPNAQKEIWTVQSGASRQALNFKQVKGLKIYLPDIERQKAFVSLIGKVNWIKKQQAQSLEEITKLFESLNCQIFKGDIVC